MSLGVVTGFAPAAGAGTVTPAGTGAPAAGSVAADAASGPLGFFGAILAMLTADTPGEGTNVPLVLPAAQREALVDFQSQPVAAGKPGAPPAEATVAIMPQAPEAPLPASAAPPSPKALLAALADQLAALQQALTGDAPLDPTLERKLGETLEALATALGIALPQPPTVDPAITDAAAAGATTGLDPLATIEAAAGAATSPSAAPAAADAAPPAVAAVAAASPPAGAAPPLPGTGITAADVAEPGGAPVAVPAGAEASNAAADDGAANPAVPPPAVAALAERIARLAAALEHRASGLADKLAALGRALAAGEVAPAQLAELGLPTETGKTDVEVAEPVARLLAPTVDPRPRPAPVPFAPPSLTLPAIGVQGDSADASDEEHPATRPALAKVPEPTVAAEAVARVPVAGRRAATAAPAMPGSQPETPAAGATTMPPSTGSTDPAPGSQQPAVAPTALPAAPTAETRAIHAAYRPVVPHLNMPQLAVEIVRQVEAGATRFQIRLDPPELGRVEVKLDVDKAGNVHARMTVDRAETLDLMQRDQRALERALAQAGLDSSKTNLEFSLRQNPFARDGNGQQQGGQQQPGVPRLGTPTAAEPLAPTILATHAVSAAGGINLFV